MKTIESDDVGTIQSSENYSARECPVEKNLLY